MVRPQLQRRVGFAPRVRYFKPQGIPLVELEELVIGDDELEALRLADVKGLYHDAAAERMNISRPTFGRIVANGRRTVARAILEGKALRIGGGSVERVEMPLNWGGHRRRCRKGWR